MNYAATSPNSSDLHSRCNNCLRKFNESEFIHRNFNLSAACNAFQEARHPLHLLRILKYLLCPTTETERYESFAIIVFSKEHNKLL